MKNNLSLGINTLLALLLFQLLSCNSVPQETTKTQSQPNIILILADDLGYGDLSCYGQEKFSTPHIDALAAGGIRFTQHYSGSTVCAPSRSVIMTGLHTGHTPIRGNKEIKPEGQQPLPDATITLAEILKAKGYATGAFGKWGLGFPGSEGDPLRQGFDRFYGYNCQRIAHNYYPFDLWDNDKKVVLKGNAGIEEKTYAPYLIQEKTLEFIDQNKTNPFFLFVPNVIPHAELKVPSEYMDKFRGKFLPEKQFEGCDPGCENYKIGDYGTQNESHAAFAGMISLLDDQVGEIVQKIKELGLEENTLILFTSDNGPHLEGGADPDYFNSNGIYRGYKRDLYEGGIRVPMIAKWPGKISAGNTTNHASAFWDILPTLAEITTADFNNDIDGISFLPVLTGQPENQQEHEYLYWEFGERGGRKAVRKDQWKLVLYDLKKDKPQSPELYDLSSDPEEDQNLATNHPEIVEELMKLMEDRTSSSVPQWNF